MIKDLGKNPSYLRKVNSKLVLDALKDDSLSAIELSKMLHLSNATLSAILKDLVNAGLIKVDKTDSVNNLGRKRVLYTINDKYGLILGVNISNFQATVTIANIKEEIIATIKLDISKYDNVAVYEIALASNNLLNNYNPYNLSLKNIIISVPGRVNDKTGELQLSKQFDPELFKEKNFIKKVFEKQYPNVPIQIFNDINISLLAEIRYGKLSNDENALFISIDTGIGGAIKINDKLFIGDNGYSGEFGLLPVKYDDKYQILDDICSLRVLSDFAKKIVNEEKVSRTRLIELYKTNNEIKEKVNESGRVLGKAILSLVEIFDITHVVIGGKATLFGDEYLSNINKELEKSVIDIKCELSSLANESKILGAMIKGVENILDY